MSGRAELETRQQEGAYASSWSLGTRLKVGLWQVTWLLLFRPTPKPLYPWRVWLLKRFGATVTGHAFVSASAVIKMPWHLTMEDRSCLGDRAEVYNLAPVTLRARCTIAQQVYLCTGTHDFSTRSLPLVVGRIEIGEDAFIGARAFVLPGVTVGAGAVVGACAVVGRDMPAWTVCAGNPCRPLKPRVLQDG